MKLLFVAKHYGYCRHFYQVFQDLIARGDEIDLVFNGIKGGKASKRGEPTGKIEGQEIVDELSVLSPNLRVHRTAIGKRKDRWAPLARHLRLFRDYFRYYHPDYVKAKKLRHRVEKLVPPLGVWLAKKLYRRLGYAPIRAWSSFYGFLEALIPADPQITRALAAFQPDLAVITPLIEADSIQVDHLNGMTQCSSLR